MFRVLTLAVAIGLMMTPVLAQTSGDETAKPVASAPTTSAPTTGAAKLPDEAIKQLETLMRQVQQSATPDDRVSNMEKLLEGAAAIETKYPDATDLHRVRLPMIQVASALAREKKDVAIQKQAQEIAKRVLDSSAPTKEKVQADLSLTVDKLIPWDSASQPSGEQSEKNIRALVEKYRKTDAAGIATAFGVRLAQLAKLKELQDEYVKDLETKYPKEEGVKGLLRQMGRHPDAGVVFEAELTRLDGTKLSLPKDLAGKVVVVDFWASWCPPCRATAPDMKKTYDKYKEKGVEFVGISLDRANGKEAAEKFIKEKNLDWIQTFSGKFWEDPTARKYSIEGIPSVWVIGKDGKVIIDGVTGDSLEDIHANLEKAIDQALGGGATTAESKPDTKKTDEAKPEK